MDDDTDNDYLGQHRLQDSLPAGPDQGCDGKEAKDADTDNDYTTDTIDTDNDYTIDDTATAHFLPQWHLLSGASYMVCTSGKACMVCRDGRLLWLVETSA